jgi:hypothetical protein
MLCQSKLRRIIALPSSQSNGSRGKGVSYVWGAGLDMIYDIFAGTIGLTLRGSSTVNIYTHKYIEQRK